MSINNIINLIRTSTRQQYNVKQIDATNEIIEKQIRILFEQDYTGQYVSNVNGELSANYPRQIFIPTADKWSEVQTPKFLPSVNVQDQFLRSCIARCRCRLVAPAIFVDGKYICRSATLSSWGEIYPRFSMDLLADAANRLSAQATVTNDINVDETEQSQQRSIFDKIRSADIDLLKIFNVGSIFNLMVQEKNALFGLKLTATEKLDKYDRYRTFQLISIPYPGCEHFREVGIQQYNGEFILHDWSASKNAAILDVPIRLSSCVHVNWSEWRSWSTIHLTQNYMQILLRHLETDEHGILIHCLSGWDRTPLFISLLRLSLWADGYIHQSLTVEEILYLTLAYDWYLFGHSLPERLTSGEEILYFTFMVLPYLVDDRFSFRPSKSVHQQQSIREKTEICSNNPLEHVTYNSNNASCSNSTSNTFFSIHRDSNQFHLINSEPKQITMRQEKLLAVSHIFHTCYRNVVPEKSTTLNNRLLGSDIARRIKDFVLQK